MNHMRAFLLKPCKGSHGYQGVVTHHNLRLDLPVLRELLLKEGFNEKVCVDIIMVMEKDNIEFTIYPSGKFLIKPAVIYLRKNPSSLKVSSQNSQLNSSNICRLPANANAS